MARKNPTSTAELDLTEQPKDQDVLVEENNAKGTDIVEYQPHEAAIVDIEKRFASVVFDVSTTTGMADAKAVRAEIRAVRYALQTTSKDVLVPYQARVKEAQARVNEVKEFGGQLVERVLKIEEPVDDVIKAEEKRQKDEKEAREKLERERVEAIQSKITRFREGPAKHASSTAAVIADVLERLKQSVILPEDYAEFEGEATIARDNAIDQLETLHKGAVQREEAEAQLKQQQEAFAAQQKELEELRRKSQEEADRRAEEERKRLAAQQEELDRQRAELDRQKEEQRKRDEQSRRDQEELTRLRAQAAAPAPVAATAPTVAAAAIDVAPLAASKPEANPEPKAAEAVSPPDQTGAPAAHEIVEVVAMSWDVSFDTARQWLRVTQF